MKTKYKYIILGAGVSGLSTAYELSKPNNDDILILEKDELVGGLCKTISKNNAFYDMGSHRIHSKVSQNFLQFADQVSVSRIIKNIRGGKLRLNKSFITYPIKSFQFFISLGFIDFFLCSFSFIKYRLKRFFSNNDHQVQNYETYLINHAGKHAYKIFYEPYAKKVWGCEPHEISVNAVKKRVSMTSPLSFIKEIIVHFFKKNNYNYYYYLQQGIGDFAKGLENVLLKKNVDIVTNSTEFQLTNVSNTHQLQFSTISGNNFTVEYENLISTIPIEELILKLTKEKEITDIAKKIRWRGLKLLYIHINEEPEYKGETFYFPEAKYIFGRVSIPKRFSGDMLNTNDYTSYVCEVPCSEGDEKWNMKPEEIYNRCFNDLVKAKLISGKNKQLTKNNFCINLAKVYPLYTVGWQENFDRLIDWLREHYDFVYSSGKCGFFLHCNMDHSVEIGQKLAQHIISGKKPAEWNNNIKEFHNYKLRD